MPLKKLNQKTKNTQVKKNEKTYRINNEEGFVCSLAFPASIAGDEEALNTRPQSVGPFFLNKFIVWEKLLSLLAPEGVVAFASTLGFVFCRHLEHTLSSISGDGTVYLLKSACVSIFRGREIFFVFLSIFSN